MGQSLLHTAARAPSSPDRLDLLDLWRIADRVARQAELRVVHDAALRQQPAHVLPECAEAFLLRQKANELLRAALGDFEGHVRELDHTAHTLRG